MTRSRGAGNIFIALLGIVIIVVAAVLIVNVVVKPAPVDEILSKTVSLRKATDSVVKADLITSLDDLIIEADSESLSEQWDRMMDCLPTACPDEAYFDIVLVTVAAFESDVGNSALLINVLATAKYWNDEERVLEFSKSLSLANDQIDSLDSRKAGKLWQAIVDCNNECSERNDLYFDLIQHLVS